MERNIAERLSKELKVDIAQVVREYYEILVLKELADNPISDKVVFKGGTALRLAYGSPRFSEDLDFSIISELNDANFLNTLQKIISHIPDSEITDLAEKYYTYLAEIKISKDFLALPFRVKIEISKRIEKKYAWKLQLIKSPCSIYSALLNTATLEQLYIDKQLCLEGRAQPKDLFDYWYISEILKRPYNPGVKIDKKILKRDLKKFLPISFHKVLEKL